VGSIADHPTICSRCSRALAQMADSETPT
jgi:hypothetical protein